MDVFDLVVGIVGLWAVIPAIVRFINRRLPSVKLRELYSTLDETESLLVSCVEDGSLEKGGVGQLFRDHLSRLRTQAHGARRQVMCARSYYQELKMIFGLTGLINEITDGVMALRADISTTSSRNHEERNRQEAGTKSAMHNGLSPQDCSVSPPHADIKGPPAREIIPSLPVAGVFLDVLHLSPALSIEPSLMTSRPNPRLEPKDESLPTPAHSHRVLEAPSGSYLPSGQSPQTQCGDDHAAPLTQRTRPPPARQSSAGSTSTWAFRRTKITNPVARHYAMARFMRRRSSGHPPPISTRTHIEIMWVSAESSTMTDCCPHDSELDGWEDVYDPL